jgi:hypothetical protein
MPLRHLTGLLLALATVAPAAAAPMSVLYDGDAAVQTIVRPGDGLPGLDATRGAFRQEPSGGHLFGAGDATHSIAKVNGAELARLSAAAIAAHLRTAVSQGCGAFRCASHLVAVDEIGAPFSDGRPRGVALPPVDPASPGAHLSAAMRLLDTSSPYGGSYASRILFYIAPAVQTSIAAGRGPNHNLGRDGKPHFTTWRGVMPALARSGGVLLEMYHGSAGAAAPFSAREWRTVPLAFLDVYHRQFGGPVANVHFMFTNVGSARPAGAPAGCATGMSCAWALAELPGVNATILANGPGVYRVGNQADEWIAQYDARFAP